MFNMFKTYHKVVKDVNVLITDKLNKSEIKVLQILQERNITNELSATKISNLAELTGLSYYTIRNIIKSFYVAGICIKGRRDGNGETYWLNIEKL